VASDSWHASPDVRAYALVSWLLVLSVPAACANGGSSGGDSPPLPDGGGDDGGPLGDGTAGDSKAGDGGDSGSGTSATKACGDNASAYCTQLEMCAPFLVTVTYGDELTCVARNTLSCADVLAAPGTGWNGDVLEACIKARTAQTCADFLEAKPAPQACRVTGQIFNGPCRYGGQCGSGYCRYASGASCGTCVNLGETGSPCTTSSDCDGNLMCAGSGTCQPPSPLTGACGAMAPCQQGLACIGMVCIQPGALGATCNAANNNADCDYNQGVYCDGTSKACTAYVVAQAAGSCGGTTPTACAGGGTCYKSACVPPAMDGSMCASATGENCLFPSSCNMGTCGLYTASLCK
jgi:hypothetical protein